MAPLVLLSFAGTALCVRSRMPLCALYQVVLFVPGGGARHAAYNLSSMSAVEAPPRECFGRAVQAAPSSASGAGSQAFYRHVATAAGCTRPRTLDVLVIQRNSTRRIVNLPELLAVLRALRGVHTARAVDLGETACLAPTFATVAHPRLPLLARPPASAATMSAQEQLELVCAHRLLVGVHGAGMEWGHVLNAGQAAGAGLIEFRAGRWPCYYAQRMKASGMRLSMCQEHDPVSVGNSGHLAIPGTQNLKCDSDKCVDVRVRLAVFKRGAQEMIARLPPFNRSV
jgi:hypothetical protein